MKDALSQGGIMIRMWCSTCGGFSPHSNQECLICTKPETRQMLLQSELQRELHPEVGEYEDPLDKDVRVRKLLEGT